MIACFAASAHTLIRSLAEWRSCASPWRNAIRLRHRFHAKSCANGLASRARALVRFFEGQRRGIRNSYRWELRAAAPIRKDVPTTSHAVLRLSGRGHPGADYALSHLKLTASSRMSDCLGRRLHQREKFLHIRLGQPQGSTFLAAQHCRHQRALALLQDFHLLLDAFDRD